MLICGANASAQTADLKITNAGPAASGGGGNFTYTLTIDNNGLDAADGATFVDTLPTSVTNVTASCISATGGAACPAALNISNPTPPPQTVSGVVTPFPALGEVVIQIQGRFPATGPSSLTNVATVSTPSGTTDPDLTTNSSSVSTALSYVADVQVIKTQSASSYTSGTPYTYTITYTNNGPSVADGSMLRDDLNFEAIYPNFFGTSQYGTVSAQYSSCAASGGATCPNASHFLTYTNVPANQSGLALFDQSYPGAVVGSWPAGGVITITYLVTHTMAPPCGIAAGLIHNYARVYLADGLTDPDSSNNASDVSLMTPASPACPLADLMVTDSVSPTDYSSGTPVTHSITIRNAGPSEADGAQIGDTLGFSSYSTAYYGTFNAQFIACVPSGGALCPSDAAFANSSGPVAGNSSAGLFSTQVPKLPSGGALTITYSVTHTLGSAPCATPGGAIDNTVSVGTPNGIVDPDATNNRFDVAQSTPDAASCLSADLGSSTVQSPTTYSSGTPITYTMVFTNAGPASADGSHISDSLSVDPYGYGTGSSLYGSLDVQFVSCSATNGAICPDASQFQSFSAVNTYNTRTVFPFDAIIQTWPSGGTLTVVYSATHTFVGLPCATSAGVLYHDVVASLQFPNDTTVDPNPYNNYSVAILDTPAAPPCPQADVSATRTRSSTGFVSGAPVTYTTTYLNGGPAAVDGSRILDVLHLRGEAEASPGMLDVRFVGCTATGGAVCPTADNFNHYSGTLIRDFALYGYFYYPDSQGIPVATWPSGGSLTVTYQITVTLPVGLSCIASTGNVDALATVEVPTGITDPNSQNNQAWDDDTFVCADISLNKSVSPSSVNARDAVTYTIDVTNSGTGDAANVAFADPLPKGFAYVSAACAAKTGSPTCGTVSYDATTRTVTSTIAALPSGTAVRFSVAGTADTTPGTYLNSASAALADDFFDPIPLSNASSVNLQIFNTASPVTITNTLTGLSKGLSTPLTLTGALVCGTQKAQNWSVTISPGSLSGSSTALTFWDKDTCTVTQDALPAPPPGYAWSGAPIIAPNPTPALGISTPLTINISNALITQGVGGLTVTKHIAGPAAGTAQVSGAFQFTADCGGSGTFTGSAIVVAGGDAVASMPAVPVDAQCQISESNALPPPPAGYAWAAVPGAQSVSIAANGTAVTVINTLLAQTVRVAISKAVTSSGSVHAGGLATFTVTVSNTGDAPALQSVVHDPLPTGVTNASWSCHATGKATCPNASGTGALNELIPAIPVAGVLTYEISATLAEGVDGSVTNTATVDAPTGGSCAPCSANASVVVAGQQQPTQSVPMLDWRVVILLMLVVCGSGVAGARRARH